MLKKPQPLSAAEKTELKAAIRYVQDHAQQMRAVLTIADKISDLSQLERMATEAQAMLDAKAVQNAELDKKRGVINADIEALSKRAAERRELTKKAELEAEEEVAAAQRRALAEAGAIINEAKDRAKAKADAIDLQTAELGMLDGEIAKRLKQLSDIEAMVAEAEQKLKRAENYLKKLAGGSDG
jgi:chromosome segregation ATPase